MIRLALPLLLSATVAPAAPSHQGGAPAGAWQVAGTRDVSGQLCSM